MRDLVRLLLLSISVVVIVESQSLNTTNRTGINSESSANKYLQNLSLNLTKTTQVARSLPSAENTKDFRKQAEPMKPTTSMDFV
jgi:hypothetical protein